jgi:arginine-tRNA-protein transferase
MPDREETKLFTYLSKSDGRELNDRLTKVGFRRAQNIIYRPACLTCDACKSSRVLVAEFTPNKNMKRILRKNSDLRRTISEPIADPEHFALISKYLCARHTAGGMEGLDETDFKALIEQTAIATELLDYRDESGELLASVLIDQLADGPSMVYSFFAPKQAPRSLGTYMILDALERAKQAGQEHLYLGFWIRGSQKMDYKKRFRPLEILDATEWKLLGEVRDETTGST